MLQWLLLSKRYNCQTCAHVDKSIDAENADECQTNIFFFQISQHSMN